MITPAILYKNMKNFVSKNKSKPVIQYIYFDGKKAYGTNLYSMAIVKNYPAAEPHFEYPDGIIAKEKKDPIDYDRVLVKEKDIAWCYTNKSIMDGKKFMTQWESTFEFLKKAVKVQHTPAILLEYKNNELIARAANEDVTASVAFLKCAKNAEGPEWVNGFNVEVLLNAVKFLKATEPHTLKVHANNNFNVLTFETEDLIITMTALMQGNADYLAVKRHFASTEDNFSFDA